MEKKIILVFIFILLLSSFTYGNKFTETDGVDLVDSSTDKESAYIPVNLLLKGSDVVVDVPGILYTLDGKSRTLVPVRFITEELGASVTWDGNTKTVTLDYNGKVIKLTIDSKYAYVNGQKIKLPSDIPAKLMSYNNIWRTMVPIRFISENFDLDIDWVEDTHTVAINSEEQDIIGIDFLYKLKFPEIRIKTTGFVDINFYTIGSDEFGIDDKMILSIPNTNLDSDKMEEDIFLTKENDKIKYDISLFGIEDVLMESEIGDIKSTNIELSLEGKKGFDIFFDSETDEIVIKIINTVTDINVKELINAKTLVIDTKENNPALSVKKEESLVYIDIVNSKLKFGDSNKEVIVNEGGIYSYSVTQLDPTIDSRYENDDEITRVTLKLNDNKQAENVFIESINNKVYAYVLENKLKRFEYVKINQAESTLEIDFLESGMYEMNFDKRNNILELVFSEELLTIENINLKIEDQIVKQININKNFGKYFIRFDLNENVSVIPSTSENKTTNHIALALKNLEIENSKYNDKLIVIDPGHGGKDPGAIGINTKITESELVLEAGLLLKKKLESKGFKVYITRESDKYVDLYQRPNIANKLNADLFISIHINAFTSPKAEGIEVLYAKDENRDNYTFAKNTHDYLISLLNRVDRGVKNHSRLVVLKNTDMPAILTELGFLTNPEEEMVLITDEYIEKASEAMFKGIIDTIK